MSEIAEDGEKKSIFKAIDSVFSVKEVFSDA